MAWVKRQWARFRAWWVSEKYGRLGPVVKYLPVGIIAAVLMGSPEEYGFGGFITVVLIATAVVASMMLGARVFLEQYKQNRHKFWLLAFEIFIAYAIYEWVAK